MPAQIRIRKSTLLAVLIVVSSLTAAFSAPGSTVAQTPPTVQCSQVLPLVTKNLSTACNTAGPDQVCYGNNTVKVQYQDPANAAPFAAVGDQVPIKVLSSISTTPLNEDHSEWGVALLRFRSPDLAGTSAGQVVTFVLYGDVNVTNLATPAAAATGEATASALPIAPSACSATVSAPTFLRISPNPSGDIVQRVGTNNTLNITRRTADNAWLFAETEGASGWLLGRNVKASCDLNNVPSADPTVPVALPGLNAFYFETGIGGQGKCQDLPAGTLLLNSPSHQKVSFRANGVDFTMGSTVAFTAQPNQTVNTYVIDGQLTATVNGQSQTALSGQMLTIPLGGDLNATGPAGLPKKGQLTGFDLAAACAILKAAGLPNPCGTRTVIPTKVKPTLEVPAASSQEATCPDPKDQRFLLPCGPICPAGHLRSNQNVCVCPQNCGAGGINVDQGGVCKCVAPTMMP